MNWRRLVLSAAGVFISQAIVAGGLQMMIADRVFANQPMFRPEGQEKFLPYFSSRVLFVLIFSWIYAKSSDRFGWAAGLRFGLLIWLFYSIPMTVGFWSFISMPDSLALAWIGIGLAEYVAGGIVIGCLYRPMAGQWKGAESRA